MKLIFLPDRYVFRNGLEWLSDALRWSVLAKVGSSPAMRLTVLVPLIGTILLFNQEVERLLSWPTFFVTDVKGATERASYNNLYFAYFGLCALGLGSMLYTLFCPREISDEPNIWKYVNETPSASAPTLSKDDLRVVFSLRFGGSEALDDTPIYARLDYPERLKSDFHDLFELLYQNADLYSADEIPEVMNGAGYLDFTPLARMVWHNVRATWPITLPFYAIAPKFARDIASLKYKSMDVVNYRSRLIVAFTYLIGFILLLIPTAHVFFLVALSFIR